VLKKLGWDKDLSAQEMAVIKRVNATNPDAVSWSIDLSGGIQRVAIKHGCSPYGNAKARMIAWNLPDPFRCTANRYLRHGPISSANIRRGRTPGSSGYRI